MIDDDDKPLEARVADLEVRAGTRRRKSEAVPTISLVDLNRRSREVERARREDKRSALGLAKTALEKAFRTNPDRAPKREQKNVSPVAAELTAQATKK